MGRTRRGCPNKKPFATMECPAPSCDSETDGYRMRGSVPGMKRHVKAVHGMDAYRRIEWPDVYGRVHVGDLFGERFQAREGSLALKSLNELRQEAKRRGVSPLGKSKKALVVELGNMDIVGRAEPPPS